MSLDGHVEEFGRSLGDELLEPTRIYARDCLAVAAKTDVRTFAHITGGGLCANIARVLPVGLTADLDRTTWTPAPVFKSSPPAAAWPARRWSAPSTWASGWSRSLPPDDVDRALAVLTASHVPSWVLGEVPPRPRTRTVAPRPTTHRPGRPARRPPRF